jgi:hypothetical protein
MIYQPKDEVEKCTFEIQIIVIKSNSPLGIANCYLECYTPITTHWDFIDIGRVVNNTIKQA